MSDDGIMCCTDGTLLGRVSGNPSVVDLQGCTARFHRGRWAVLKRAGIGRIADGYFYRVTVVWDGYGRGIPVKGVRA